MRVGTFPSIALHAAAVQRRPMETGMILEDLDRAMAELTQVQRYFLYLARTCTSRHPDAPGVAIAFMGPLFSEVAATLAALLERVESFGPVMFSHHPEYELSRAGADFAANGCED
jgi:hypothetical protein